MVPVCGSPFLQWPPRLGLDQPGTVPGSPLVKARSARRLTPPPAEMGFRAGCRRSPAHEWLQIQAELTGRLTGQAGGHGGPWEGVGAAVPAEVTVGPGGGFTIIASLHVFNAGVSQPHVESQGTGGDET